MAGKSLRRFFQLRLATLLVLITLAATSLGIWFHKVEPFHRQAKAREKLSEVTSSIVDQPSSEKWLIDWFGSELVTEVVEIRCEHEKLTEEHIQCFRDLPFLRRLYVGGTNVNDSTLFQIAKIPTLERLALWRTDVTDDGLRMLSKTRSKLHALDIHTTAITDEGLSALEDFEHLEYLILGGALDGPGLASVARLPKLEMLDLRRASVTEESLHYLKGSSVRELRVGKRLSGQACELLAELPNLRHFDVGIADASDANVASLSRCENLSHLSIDGNQMSNVALKHISKMQRLASLTIRGDFDDDGIVHLINMPQLSILNIAGRFTAEGEERIRRECPAKIATVNRPQLGSAIPIVNTWDFSNGVPLMNTEPASHNRLPYALVIWPASFDDYLEQEGDLRTKLTSITFLADYPRPKHGFRSKVMPRWNLEKIDQLPALRNITIQGRISGEDLGRLSSLVSLRTFMLYGHQVTDAELAQIELPPNFEMLSVDWPSLITPSAKTAFAKRFPNARLQIRRFENSTSRRQFDALSESLNVTLHLNEIGPVDLASLGKNPNLRTLNITNRENRPRDWFVSESLPKLKRLSLTGAATNHHLRCLQHMPDLENLTISSGISDDGLRFLKHTPKLQTLTIGSYSTPPFIRGMGLESLQHCPDLRQITLASSSLEGHHLVHLSGLSKLRQLTFQRTKIADEGMEHVGKIRTLETFRAAGTFIGDAGAKHLAQLPKLSNVDLKSTNVTDAALRSFADSESLRTLDVRNCAGITPQGAALYRTQRPDVRFYSSHSPK